jgi:hypothetical protein
MIKVIRDFDGPGVPCPIERGDMVYAYLGPTGMPIPGHTAVAIDGHLGWFWLPDDALLYNRDSAPSFEELNLLKRRLAAKQRVAS